MSYVSHASKNQRENFNILFVLYVTISLVSFFMVNKSHYRLIVISNYINNTYILFK